MPRERSQGADSTRLLFCLLIAGVAAIPAAARESIQIKHFPQDAVVLDAGTGTPLEELEVEGTWRSYRLRPGTRILRFEAEGYEPLERPLPPQAWASGLEVKLERAARGLEQIGEYATGGSPKSVAFDADGNHVIVPLMNGTGADVFSADDGELLFRLSPGEPAASEMGFVEALVLADRREVWISQMPGARVHGFSLDDWSYIGHVETGGSMPKVIAADHNETTLYVSNWGTRNVSVIDVADLSLRSLIPVGGVPRGLAFHPDGRHLYVALFEGAARGSVEKIDTETGRVARTMDFVPGGAARHIVVDDESRTAYVSDMMYGKVYAFSVDTHEIVADSGRIGSNLNTIDLSPDGAFLYVSERGRNNPVSYYRTGPVFGRVFALDSDSLEIRDWEWGRNQPTGLAISPDGTRLAFTDFLDNNLQLYEVHELRLNGGTLLP